MSDPIRLPDPEDLARRIRDCREELAALRRLQRMARAAQAAREAHERRQLAGAGEEVRADE
jgi:ribosomal protein L29